MISVIIPVYNAGAYLQKTIDCLLKQTTKDYEVILINDGSTDNSLSICNNIASRDNRFKVINKENGGASAARNDGLRSANNELITFIDADDEISDNYLFALLSSYNNYSSPDLIIQGLIQVFPTHKKKFQLEEFCYDLENNAGLFFDKVFLNDFSGPYCKLFKRSIIENNDIVFNSNIIYAEDFDFLLNYLRYCKTVVTSNVINYFYFMRNDSVSAKNYPFEKELNGLEVLSDTFYKLGLKYNFDSLTLMKKISLNEYIWRVLYSNYRFNYTKTERVNHLMVFNKNFNSIFLSNFISKSHFSNLIKELFVKKRIKYLDFLMYIRLNLVTKILNK